MTSHHSGPDAAALREVVDGVFAWVQPDGTWWVNNAGVVTGGGGIFVVDTCATEQRTRRFLAAVTEVEDGAPIRWAVNTHLHGDHTYGNCLLPESTVLIGHEKMRDGLLADPLMESCPPVWSPVPDWGRVVKRAPDVVLRNDVTVFNGSRRIDLVHPGFTAHTPGDVVAWLPEERVLFTGDLVFHGLTPLVFMGSVDGALRSLDWLASFEPQHIVPGHGPLLDASDRDAVLAQHERYYRLVQTTATSGAAAGLTPLQAAQACDLAEFASWADSERLVLNLHRAYADAAGTDLDLAAALADTLTYNNGPMETSV
jgi:cyclase